mmetsp:Transcript_11193/g.69090  ORF Transcript_11193/g.69090 Transcript_11193/m.69090 type:complete len:158 (-) Transcript_11193:3107-3580(-)
MERSGVSGCKESEKRERETMLVAPGRGCTRRTLYATYTCQLVGKVAMGNHRRTVASNEKGMYRASKAFTSLFLLFSMHVPYEGSVVISMFKMMHMTTRANTIIVHGARETNGDGRIVTEANVNLALTSVSCLCCMHCRNRVPTPGIAEVVGITQGSR